MGTHPKVLVVGRQVEPLDPLRRQLSEGGFEVAVCAMPDRASEAAAADQPNLILLELGPGLVPLDALAACQRIHLPPGDPHLPVMVLGDEQDAVDGVAILEHGADDFISRPYDSRELVARVRVLLRRSARAAAHGGVLAAGPIELDVDRYTVSLSGRPLEFTAKEFELLKTLIEARGRIVRREAALEQVWSYDRNSGIDSRTLDVHIRRLRKKLGAEGARIITVRNVGYRMDIDPAWIVYGR